MQLSNNNSDVDVDVDVLNGYDFDTLRTFYKIFLKFLMLQQIFFVLCIIQLHIG